MQRKDKFKIAFMNLKKDKSKYLVGWIFVVCVMIIFFSFSVYNFFMEAISDEENTFYYHRFFMYYEDYETREFNEVRDEALSVEHVSLVIPSNYSETSVYLDKIDNQKVEEDVLLVASTSDISLNIAKGRNLENSNEIVCPVIFYPYDDLEYNKNITNNDVVYMSKYLNKTINFTYKGSDDITHNISFKLVGVYRNSMFDWDEDRCFVLSSDISEIENNKGNFEDVYDEENGAFSFPIILIDDVSYLDEVEYNLSQYNIYIEGTYKHDDVLYSLLPFIIFIIVIICCSVSIIILVLLVNKKIKDNRGNLSLLKTFGYSNKDIIEILFYESLILNVIYVFIGTIITLVIYFILKIITYFRPFYFGKVLISYSFVSIPICLLIALVLSFISVIFFRKDINDLNIINILREDD